MRIWKIRHSADSGPGCGFIPILQTVYFPVNTFVYIIKTVLFVFRCMSYKLAGGNGKSWNQRHLSLQEFIHALALGTVLPLLVTKLIFLLVWPMTVTIQRIIYPGTVNNPWIIIYCHASIYYRRTEATKSYLLKPMKNWMSATMLWHHWAMLLP